MSMATRSAGPLQWTTRRLREPQTNLHFPVLQASDTGRHNFLLVSYGPMKALGRGNRLVAGRPRCVFPKGL